MGSAEEQADRDYSLRLTAEERKLLLKACQHFRASIPIYLKAGAHEALVIGDLIRRLSLEAPSE